MWAQSKTYWKVFCDFPEHQIYIVSFAGLVVGTEENLRAKPSVICLIMSLSEC